MEILLHLVILPLSIFRNHPETTVSKEKVDRVSHTEQNGECLYGYKRKIPGYSPLTKE